MTRRHTRESTSRRYTSTTVSRVRRESRRLRGYGRAAPTRSDVVGRAPVRSDDGGGAAGDRVFLVSKINRRYDGDGDGDGDGDDDRRPRRRGAKREPSNGDVAHVIRVRARGG